MKTDNRYIYNDIHIELSDISLVSSLQYLNFPIVAISRDPKEYPKVSFIFEKSDELNNAIHRYWEGLLLVEPKAYWNIARELKSRIRAN